MPSWAYSLFLAEGGRVQFEIAQGEKGAQAENVEPLD
ncbi:cold shock domain-containing protein [Brevibacterium ravenspurgense]|nr:cold shock domain-containing protein [Brevibacterium ravenspurgense]